MRINAIKHDNGSLGCVRSHIKCLEYAIENRLRNILIFEDDFIFTETAVNIKKKLASILSHYKNNWDIIMLSSNTYKDEQSGFSLTRRILDAQTASGYLINRHYFKTLLASYKESERELEKGGEPIKWALDQHWKKLQVKDKWYVMEPTVGKQKESYSDIEQKMVNYNV